MHEQRPQLTINVDTVVEDNTHFVLTESTYDYQPDTSDGHHADQWLEEAPASVSVTQIEDWQDAYAEYLRTVETYGYYPREYIMSGNYDVPPVFSLFDIDKNGIPELILISDNGCEVFSYIDGAVKSIGCMAFDWFGAIGVPDNITEGLFSDDSYKGHYGLLYYYTIEDDVLVERLCCEYNYRPAPGESNYTCIYPFDDNALPLIFTEGYAEYPEIYEQYKFSFLKFYQITETTEQLLLAG